MSQLDVKGENLQYISGADSAVFIEKIEHEILRGWFIKTIDRTNDGRFYAFLEFPR